MPPKSFKPTRERKQRRRKTVQRDGTTLDGEANPATTLQDTNAEIVIPGAQAAKAPNDNDSSWKKEEAPESKMSAKKRKRFNKYMVRSSKRIICVR